MPALRTIYKQSDRNVLALRQEVKPRSIPVRQRSLEGIESRNLQRIRPRELPAGLFFTPERGHER